MNNAALTRIDTARTKSGKTTNVAVLSWEAIGSPTLERLHWAATEVATPAGCSHYRVYDASGALKAAGKAGELKAQAWENY